MDYTKYNEVVQKWIHYIEENAQSNTELTLKYCNDLIEYGTEAEDDTLMALGHYYRGLVYYISNEGSLFYEAVTRALTYLTKLEEWELMARCYNFLGIAFVNRGNAVVGLDYYMSAINCCKKAEAKGFECTVMINIGALYVNCGRYEDAIEHLQTAMEYYSNHPEHPKYDDYMLCIYQNMAKAYICKGMLIEAKCCFERIFAEHKNSLNETAQISIWATEAMYYHVSDDDERCDGHIARIHKHIQPNVPIMDMFDDIYDYIRILLDREKDEEFWRIIDVMEPMARSAGITNLVLRILSLKLKFYSRRKQQHKYLEAAGEYFELAERIELENRVMMNNVLTIRKNLEQVNLEKEEVEKNNELLREKSETDALTGLSNRFGLETYSQKIFQRAVENRIPLVVEILDIDYFKEYNDHYGHQKGDECIQKIASVIKSMEAFGAYTVRYGGDEFVLIYENITKDLAIEYAAELRKRVLDLGIEHYKSKISLVSTVSQGICWDIPGDGNTIKDFINTADTMLYRVKQKKRNNFCVGNLTKASDQIVMSYL